MKEMTLDTFNARLARALDSGDAAAIHKVFKQGMRYGDTRVQRAVKYRRETLKRQAERKAAEAAERAARIAAGEPLRLDAKAAPVDVSGPHCHKGHGGVFPSAYSTTAADKAYCREVRPYVAAPKLSETPKPAKWDMYHSETA